jgi:hypothetical protein
MPFVDFDKVVRDISSDEIEIIKTFFDLSQDYEDDGFVFVAKLRLLIKGNRSIDLSVDRNGKLFYNGRDISMVDYLPIRLYLYSLNSSSYELVSTNIIFQIQSGPMNRRILDAMEDMEIKMLEYYPDMYKSVGYSPSFLVYFFIRN